MTGKGSKRRPCNTERYAQNYDRIFRKKKSKGKNKKQGDTK